MKPEVYQQRLTEVDARISRAWKQMHHNASIARHYPDFRNEYESESFWNWLSMRLSFECDSLESVIEKKFGIVTKLYTAGRQGATVYPEVFHSRVGGNSFGMFDWSCFHQNYDSDRAELAHRERVAKFLEWFNAYWAKQASKVTSQWKSYKRKAGLSSTIRSYDGMTKRTVTVWG